MKLGVFAYNISVSD